MTTNSPGARPIVEVHAVSKSYGAPPLTTPAVCGLSFDVPRSEFVSIMGPSGSGKSTLLNLIAGLDQPDAGSIRIDGQPLAELSDYRISCLRLRKIGFVFQGFNLIPAMPVAENVAWPLQFAGQSRVESLRRAIETLGRVGMAGREARYPAELSGGEQQRVAIARAIATGPIVLLADEPTGNLDSVTGRAVLDLLRALNNEDGVTVVMVTHSAFAASYGDRTIELRDGTIVRDVRTPSDELSATAYDRTSS